MYKCSDSVEGHTLAAARCAMARIRSHPDRDFSADEQSEPDAQALRDLLKRGEVADISDPPIRQRIGEAIARALSHRLRVRWRKPDREK